jgi:hypothetical protein
MTPQPDTRSQRRRELDEQIADEAPLAPPDLPAGVAPGPVESHLKARRRPVAVAGVVENGLIRPLDPTVKFPDRSRVIIVATEGE